MHYLTEHQTFSTTRELNNAIYTHIKRNSFDMNDTELLTLKTIARYAVKFAGVAHLKAATLAELIGKSEKTARRAIAKLAELGIVKKVATTRKVNGGKGANIIVIQPPGESEPGLTNTADDQSNVSNRQAADKPTESSAEPSKSGTEPSVLIKQLKKNNLRDTYIPSVALKSALPSEIYTALSRYFDADNIYKYYGILLRAKRSINRDTIIEDNAEPFVNAFYAAILKAKQGKVKSLSNYLFRAWQQATREVSRRDAFNAGVMYDWLSEE